MVSVVKNEPGRTSDWLLYEEDDIGRYSRDNVVVAANQTLKSGAVVGLNDAGTQVVDYDDASPDGAVALGILVEDVTTGAATTKAAIVTRHAKIAVSGLVWKTGLLQAAKDAALADLRARGILVAAEA